MIQVFHACLAFQSVIRIGSFFFPFFFFFAEVVVFVFSLWGRGEKDLIRVGTPKAGNLADSFGFQHLNAWRKICITRNQSPWTYAKELAVRQEHV